tara:strand:- start:86 stop:265 length:180 start_codon:yes stop_codon:yes gene_type:complete
MTDRINKQIITYIKDLHKKTKEMGLLKNLKKEVNTGANGTQGYVIKKGINKDTIATTKQ